MGLEQNTGKDWFKQAGGVAPQHLLAALGGRYLSLLEREEIWAGVEHGDSIRQVARRLGRAPSTVSRELHRNMKQPYRAAVRSA